MELSWEIILAFVAGVVLIALVAWVTHVKARGVTKLVINSLAGGALIMGLSAFNVIVLPFNIFNALLIGVLGMPGAGIVVAAALLL